jgi:hypothetical protein
LINNNNTENNYEAKNEARGPMNEGRKRERRQLSFPPFSFSSLPHLAANFW